MRQAGMIPRLAAGPVAAAAPARVRAEVQSQLALLTGHDDLVLDSAIFVKGMGAAELAG
jgi:hypothetical protein